MTSRRINANVSVEFDEADFTVTLSASTGAGSDAGVRGGRRSFGGAPVVLDAPAEGAAAEFAAALVRRAVAQKVDAPIVFDAPSQAPSRPNRGPSSALRSAQLHVEVDDGQQAVVLLEGDGVLAWRFPSDGAATSAPSDPAPAMRRGVRSAAGRRVLTFNIAVPEISSAADAQRRGWVKDKLLAAAKAVVLYFAADYAAGKIVSLLEKSSRNGPVVITSETDVARWLKPADFSAVDLPASGARILLLVHGTFSSTVGGFGGLVATPWGRKFLRGALDRYDAVLGFDHKSLSLTPDANATALLEALRTLKSRDIVVDAVCHSRGGLVLRSLIEAQLPGSRLGLKITRAVFVAATNAGTELARPANWESLVDLVTNLTSVTTKVLKLFPAAAAVAAVAEEVIACIGDFVKYLVEVAVTERKVPGIAAMEPGGAFVTEINATQPNQPGPADIACYAIVSNFQARLGGSETHEPAEFPRRLAMLLADGVVDRLMRGDQSEAVANDLVVDVASMTSIDAAVPGFVRDVMDFGTNAAVYHTNYFLRPETAGHLAQWLGLPSPMADFDPLELAGVHRGLVTANAATSVQQMKVLLGRNGGANYVVLNRRDPRPGHRGHLHYAFRRDEIEGLGGPPDATLVDALNLHESGCSQTGRASAYDVGVMPRLADHEGPAARRGIVVTDGEMPVAVVDDGMRRIGITELAARTTRMAAVEPPSRPSVTPRTRGGSRQAPAKRPAAAVRPRATLNLHALAEMPSQVTLGRIETLTVTLSAEAVAQTAGKASEQGSFKTEAGRRILVDVIVRSGFDDLDADAARVEVDPPTPKGPVVLDFDVRARDLGAGEVMVRIRQGAVRLLTLTVRSWVTAQATTVVPLASSAAPLTVVDEPDIGASLSIFDRRDGSGELRLQFILDAGESVCNRFFSDAVRTEPQKYVESTYKKIEEAWTGSARQVERFEANLCGWGGEMFRTLFPPALQQALWSLAAEGRLYGIRVHSDEPFIPWEIVYLSDPAQPGSDGRFLAEYGLCRWLYGAAPVRALMVRRNRTRSVVPHYPEASLKLASAEDVEEPYLTATLGAVPVKPADHANVLALLKGPGAFDLIHFACHGQADLAEIGSSQLLLEGEILTGSGGKREWAQDPLEASTVRQFANLRGADGSRPLVVVNACQTGRAGYSLTEVGGFASAFLGTREGSGDSRGQAAAFVGALWSIGDKTAATFVIALYDALRQGKTMAEASRVARAASRAAGEPTWLAYTVYAHPRMKVRFA
ncbi:MAG TPA: CHAT domain-containing protein [Caldimonas sp.]|jgi:hypothetical protein|nr:CHAT domain-containing protein [Caldimonas sp.]HEX2541467.1 CHAT domain-containing protein [Caldimonas sp.]